LARLVYSSITSLDGYSVDASGSFDWSAPDEEVHRFINDRERSVGTYLYGRRMYEVMRAWESMDDPDPDSATADFAAVWRGSDKIVFSSTLPAVSTARTRLERRFDAAAVARLIAESPTDVSIGGPGLAAEALRAGLVAELTQYVSPVIVGGGTRWLPECIRLDLTLVDEHRFSGGVVALTYRVGEILS
jgi:dihydrofolate reductase